MQDGPSDPQRHFHRWLLAAVAVGALWRFGVLIVDKWNQPLLLNDSIYYSGQARQLTEGRWFRELFVDHPGAEHGPLTSLLLAPVSWGADPVPWQRLMTVVFGVVTIALIGLLGRRVGGPQVGIVAALIAAFYPNLWMNDGLVMSESLSMMLVTAVVLVAHRALAAPVAAPTPTRVLVALGAVAGLAALARSELALLVPGLAVLVWRCSSADDPSTTGPNWRRRLMRPLLVLGAAAVVMAPWVVFNLVRFERPVTLTTNDGTTLLGSYCSDSFGGPEIGGWSLICVIVDPDYGVDEEPSVRSARQRSLAIAFAREHVDRLPVVVAARIGRSLDLYGLDSLVHQDVGEERYRWASWAGIVSWWVLAAAAVLGARRLDRPTRWLLALPVASVAFTTIVFYGGHRIRSSMEPVVVVAAAVFLVGLLDRRRRRRPASAAGDVGHEGGVGAVGEWVEPRG